MIHYSQIILINLNHQYHIFFELDWYTAEYITLHGDKKENEKKKTLVYLSPKKPALHEQ